MSKSVRVIRFHKTGGPEVLKVEEITLPDPRGREVLVRVLAIGLSRVDALWREGTYFEEPPLPAGIGYCAAGVVESIGPEVQTVKVGEHVSTIPAAALSDYTAHGEMILYPEQALFVHPSGLNSQGAVAVNTSLFGAYFALAELSGVRSGQYVVITAASSSMGVGAIQVAKRLGAKTIVVTRSESKKQGLSAAGADYVVVAGTDDVQDAILDVTKDAGADIVYDGVGGPGLEELVWATRRFGRLVVYGCLGGMEEATRVPLGACFLRGLNLHPTFKIFDFTGHRRLSIPPNREAVDRARRFVFDGLNEGAFQPKVDRIFIGLDQYAAAHEYMATDRQIGKIVVSLE
jgi:NADPH:quinone reductase-like Zn-dependent oxidoreductase